MIMGCGAQGTVVLHGKLAIKKHKNIHTLIRECAFLTFLKGCEGVVPIRGFSLENRTLNMDSYECNLRTWVSHARRPLKAVLLAFRETARALCNIHAAGLVHGDIKPENILVNASSGDVEIACGDFGHCSLARFSRTEHTTRSYRDPLHERSAAHDMYSLGKCILSLIPDETSGTDYLPAPVRRYFLLRRLPERERSLLEAMMRKSPSRRPSSRDVCVALEAPAPKGRTLRRSSIAPAEGAYFPRDKNPRVKPRMQSLSMPSVCMVSPLSHFAEEWVQEVSRLHIESCEKHGVMNVHRGQRAVVAFIRKNRAQRMATSFAKASIQVLSACFGGDFTRLHEEDTSLLAHIESLLKDQEYISNIMQ